MARKSSTNHSAVLKSKLHDGRGNPVENLILLALPTNERDAVLPKLEFVDLPLRTMLIEVEQPIRYAYFLNGGLGSVLTMMSNRKNVEVGLTGKEGFVGVPLLAGFNTSPTRVLMQVAGCGFRMKAQDLMRTVRRCNALQENLSRYSQEMTLQATQVAACNRLHQVEAQLARWLLMSQDRLGGDRIALTQEFLAHMLGTRRATVSVASGRLEKAGLITCSRGETKIENRRKLEKAACECYKKLTDQTARWREEKA